MEFFGYKSHLKKEKKHYLHLVFFVSPNPLPPSEVRHPLLAALPEVPGVQRRPEDLRPQLRPAARKSGEAVVSVVSALGGMGLAAVFKGFCFGERSDEVNKNH